MLNTGHFTLKLLHWHIRFWLFMTGFGLIQVVFETNLTDCSSFNEMAGQEMTIWVQMF